MKFSVIIPLFNKSPYIAKAIESVLAQTCTDYELIIVDDGSSDNSYIAAQETIKGHVNCRVFQQTNSGVSKTRNHAADLAQGDYLCFLDADDWWSPSFLERVAVLIAACPEAGIYGTGYTIVNETRHKTRVAAIGIEPGFEIGYIDYFRVYANTMYMPLWTGAVCIPRHVFEATGGFNPVLKLGEDFDLWIRIALKEKVAFINEPLSYYNQDSDPQWRGVGHLREPACHVLWNLGYLEEYEKTDPDYKQLIDNLRTYSLFPYYLSKQYREAAKRELEKVDWAKQPDKTKSLYDKPVLLLWIRQRLLSMGSRLKQWINKLI